MRLGRLHRFFVQGIIFCVTSYFIAQKSTNVSFSSWVNSILQPRIVGLLLPTLCVLIWYAVVASIVLYVFDYFRKQPYITLHSPHQRCLLKCNGEIDKHLKELFSGKFDLRSMVQKHTYEENLQFLHQSMADHFREALKAQKFVVDDLFVSVFHDPTFSPEVQTS